jgi:N-acetylglucosamine kinase-like BadF-type ATPase
MGRGGGEQVSEVSAASAVLAVDGGASKTDVWVVAADGTILGTARGGGPNHQLVGIDGAMETLASTIATALGDAGLGAGTGKPPGTGVYCLAGLDFDVDEERLGASIRSRRWTSTDIVRNDSLAVLRAGVVSGWGVGVVCGSGINCVGLGEDGTVVRFPSLGELSGDFAAGGSWLGIRALGLALRARDGRGRPTLLAERVPAHFGLDHPEAVLAAVYTGQLGYGRLVELARVCLEAADAGDAEAASAVAILADEVVALVRATVHRLGVTGVAVEVVLGGGLFDGDYAGFAATVETSVRRFAPGARFRRLSAPPVLGAALLGLDAIGAPDDAADRLRATAPGAAHRPHR